MSFEKFSFCTLLAVTLVSGFLLVESLIVKAGLIDAKGRVVRWEKDYVTIRFASENYDSLTVRTKVPYTKNKAVLAEYEVIPVKYNPMRPAKFEIKGVKGSFIGGILFFFCFSLTGLVSATINLIRIKKSPD